MADLPMIPAPDFRKDGFEIIPKVLTHADCESLINAIEVAAPPKATKAAGVRNLLRSCTAVKQLARSTRLLRLLRAHCDSEPFPVRAIYFDKTPESNWGAAWHQDLLIAVKERRNGPGYGPWSVKSGVIHVQPPQEVLEAMLTLRLHLDAGDESNGALQVLPGSHHEGILDDAIIERWKQKPSVLCTVNRGDVLLMRPLLLHASSKASRPLHRRVLHIEYGTYDLPGGLRWAEAEDHSLAVVALGSNLGDSPTLIRRAVERLRTQSDEPLRVSSLWRTAPAECPPGSPDFVNAVVVFVPREGETPESLLSKLQTTEREFGRLPKQVPNEPRPLDLDLIGFGDEVRATTALTLPHPRAHLRRFVLQPMAEVAPDLILPGQKFTVAQLLASLGPEPPITRLDL